MVSGCYASICNPNTMDFFRWICIIHCLIAAQLQWTCWSLSVRFLYKEPVYVALGKTLVLEAQFELQPGENIRLVMWDRKKGSEVRLVTDGKPTDKRISVGKNGALLKLTGVKESDYGSYIVTVTDANGDQVSSSVEVRQVQRPPKAVLSLECTVVTEGAQWDKPVFSWWVDGQEITNNTGNLSADGSKLHLSGSLGDNYTCVIDSSQGTSVVQHLRAHDPDPDPTPTPNPTPVPSPETKSSTLCTGRVWVLSVIAVILAGFCIWLGCRKWETKPLCDSPFQ